MAIITIVVAFWLITKVLNVALPTVHACADTYIAKKQAETVYYQSQAYQDELDAQYAEKE